jgi:hypothetical protein
VLDFILGDTYRALVHTRRPVEYRRGIPTIVGVFAHAGTAGWFMAFCSCLSLAFWTVKRAPVHLFLTLAFAGSVLLTLRRKPIVGLVAVFVVAVLLTGQKRSGVRTVIAASLLLACFVVTAGDVIVLIFQDMLSQYFYTADPFDVARNAMHVASIEIAIDYFPLGAGFGRFGGWIATLHYSPLYYEYGLSMIHGLSESRPTFLQDAFWPHVIGELGFIGAFLFVLAMFRMVAPLMRGVTRHTPIITVVSYAAVFSFIEAIPESFGSVIFEKTVSAGLIFGLLGLAWNARIARDSTVPNQ